MAIPEATVRDKPLPSSRVSFKSFLALGIGSQAVIFAARSSTFAKSSIPICSIVTTFSAFSCSAAFSAAISAKTFSASNRAKSGVGAPTEYSLTAPKARTVLPLFNCSAIDFALSGIMGESISPKRRIHSSRL